MSDSNKRLAALKKYGDLGKCAWLQRYGMYIVSGQPVWVTRKTLTTAKWNITPKEAIAELCDDFGLAPMSDEGAEQYCLLPREDIAKVTKIGNK